MNRTWGAVLGGLVLSIGCGSSPNPKMVYGDQRHARKMREIVGQTFTNKQLARIQEFDRNLIAEPWIGLSEKRLPLENAALQLRSTQLDSRSLNYQYTFDLLVNDTAVRGKTQLVRGPHGEIEGFVSGPGYVKFHSDCIDLASIAWYAPEFYTDICVYDRSRKYEGTRLTFAMTTSEIGPLLRVTFQKPMGEVAGYELSELYFQQASKVKK